MSLISRSRRRHVVLDDREQAAARFVAAGERQRLDGAAQRGQRVLELVGDVGGEALDRVDAAVEGAGHLAQRAGEMPDLVRSGGEIRDLLARLDASADPLGGLGKAPHRAGDGAGEQHRQHDHDERRDEEDLQQGEALGGDDLVDVAALRREQQRAAHRAEALDRNRHRDDGLAARVLAHDGGARAAERLAAPRASVLPFARANLLERRPILLEQAADLVPGALDEGLVLLAQRRQVEAQDVAARVEVARIEQQAALAVVDRARVRVGLTRRRSSGATRSGLIENSSGDSASSPSGELSPACICSSRSGSMLMVSESTVAEAAMAPAMISLCVRRLWTRASMRPWRNWLR